jgi:hypothetical protein
MARKNMARTTTPKSSGNSNLAKMMVRTKPKTEVIADELRLKKEPETTLLVKD